MSAALPTADEARELLAQTFHSPATQAAAVAVLENESLSIREAGRRWGINAASVCRALAKIRPAGGAQTQERRPELALSGALNHENHRTSGNRDEM